MQAKKQVYDKGGFYISLVPDWMEYDHEHLHSQQKPFQHDSISAGPHLKKVNVTVVLWKSSLWHSTAPNDAQIYLR